MHSQPLLLEYSEWVADYDGAPMHIQDSKLLLLLRMLLLSGANGWAPIMGVGYYQELTQWSKGEYAGANNVSPSGAPC